jgi:uncharacterized Tic20 family protein
MDIPNVIPAEQRGLAAFTHLSGLAGYIIPLGGVIVPIIIWVVKSDSPVIAAIAKQAVLLNVVVFFLVIGLLVLFLTVILIPFVILGWIVLGLMAIALPIVGAIKASEGTYYKYPLGSEGVSIELGLCSSLRRPRLSRHQRRIASASSRVIASSLAGGHDGP